MAEPMKRVEAVIEERHPPKWHYTTDWHATLDLNSYVRLNVYPQVTPEYGMAQRDQPRLQWEATASIAGDRGVCVVADTCVDAQREVMVALAQRFEELSAWLVAHAPPLEQS